MLFIEDLLTTVLQTTGRPDQKAWALVSLNNCLKELSRTADYPQDLYETEFLADDPGGAELSGPINLPIPGPSTFIIRPSSILKISFTPKLSFILDSLLVLLLMSFPLQNFVKVLSSTR